MMFKHNNSFSYIKGNYELTESIKPDHGRFYHYNDSHYPSVTTILGNTKDKKFLEDWKKRIGEDQAERELRQANVRGTKLHHAVELFLDNVPPTEIYKKEPSIISTCTDIFSTLRKNITQVYLQECPLISRYYKTAGRVDCIADWNSVPAIVDFKTSKKPKNKEWITDYFIQATAYKLMWREMTGMDINKTVIVIVNDYGFVQVFEENNPDHWIDEFKLRVKQYYDEYHTTVKESGSLE